MIKIIEHGSKVFNGTCFTCGCKFTYETDDVVGYSVICPDCGGKVMHYSETAVNGSKFTNKDEKKTK